MIISLRLWLVSSFAAVLLLCFSGIFLFLNYVNKSKSIEDYHSNLKTARILLLESNQLKEDIFIGENNNDEFFRVHNSKVEKAFKDLNSKTVYYIHLLEKSDITAAYTLNWKVTKLKLQLNKFNQTYNKLIYLYKLKGFKDYGIEGKMRKHAHDVFDYNNTYVKLLCLMLRKHEKDFLLRKDLQYVRDFEKVSEAFYKFIKEEKSIGTADKNKLVKSLYYYSNYFKLLSQIETKIGVKGRNGCLNQSTAVFNNIAATIEDMDNELKLIKIENNAKLQSYTIWAIAILVTFLMGIIIILNQLIMRSVKYISKSFTTYVNSGFNFDSISYKRSKIKEFNAIYTSFLKMAKEINIFTNFFREKVLERTKEITLQNDEIFNQQKQIKLQYDALVIKSNEINEQRLLLTSKDNDIQESLRYAQRIQKAIQPGNSQFKKRFVDSFIFSQAKDVVSGDFCLLYEVTQNNCLLHNRIVFAVSDCTGHGVPGAMMSVLGINILRKIVKSAKVSDPGKILNLLNKNIDQVLSHGKGRGLVADGMDIAVFSFDPQTYLLEYSIAKFSQFVVRNGLVINLDTQKYSIGYNFLEADFKKFDTSLLQLVAGDTLYVFSDGFQDQFGGASDRKFKKNNLTKLLVEINHLPMEAQKELLKKKLDAWKGNNIQTDDILILGLRF